MTVKKVPHVVTVDPRRLYLRGPCARAADYLHAVSGTQLASYYANCFINGFKC